MMQPQQGVGVSNDFDEYTRWKLEPWVPFVDNPITYWFLRRRDYPNFTRLALDVLSIPASSCDFERMFSELGDLVQPKRRKISAQLLVAIQSVRAWLRAGFGIEGETAESLLSDEAIDVMYNLGNWHDSEAYFVCRKVISLNKLPDQFSSSLAGSQFNQFTQLFQPAFCSSIQAKGCKLTERIVDISAIQF
jgi:hypothetical protein